MNSINENNLKLGIIGYPLSHTLSPQIHEYWLKLHRISGTYEILEVSSTNLKLTLDYCNGGCFWTYDLVKQ